MSSSSFDLSGFYKILLPFPDSTLSIQYLPLYFTQATRYPKFQFKYFKMRGFHIPDEFLSPSIVESLMPNSILLEFTQEKDFFPVFRLMSSSEFDECFEFFSKNPELNNFYYTVGSIYEKRLDYVRAKDYFQRGCDHNECFSLLKMVRILAEPHLAEKFQLKQDLSKSLSLLLSNFLTNGFFDCFTPNFESFHGIYLLYLYLDCFPELTSLAHKQSLKNPLLKLLLTIDWNNHEVYQIVQEIETQYEENLFLLGDLYHPKILGVNIETEFNKMQEKYTSTLRNNRNGWLKVACLNEGFLNHELKRLAKSKGTNQILEESIRKINKNIDTAYKRLEGFPEFACSFELLHYQASNSNKKALELAHLDNYRRLSKFGDETILRVFFKVLKFHFKKAGNPGDRADIAQELFLIASKIAHIDHEFREAPLAFCFEKGLGIAKNFPAAFNLYRDLLKKIIISGFEIHFFCYRFASLLKAAPSAGFEDASNFFFQVAYWSLMSSINEEDYNGFYELGKFYLKGRGIEANESYALKIYENLLRNIKEKKRDSLNDQILIQLLTRKIGKIKKTGPSAIKNNETESLKEFIGNEKKNSNKIIKNWPLYKTLSSGSSVTTEMLNALNNLNEKFKTLNPNLEEISGKIYLPYAKAQLSIIGNLKPKEMNKDHSEVPKWKSSMKNSIKKKEELITHIKDTLGKYLHYFEIKDLNLNFTEPKHLGSHELYPAVLKHNNQVFSFKILEISELQETNFSLLEKLEVYCKVNSPYFLNMIAFTVEDNAAKPKLYLFYETFTESLGDFLDQNETNFQIHQKYFSWLMFIVQTFQNSGFLFSYLTENNFVIAKTLVPKLADFDFEILNKTNKQTVTIDPAKSMALMQFSQYSIPPELLYGFMKSNKSTLSSGSVVWSLGTIGFWMFTKRRLFEGVEVKTYDDFKIFYNQEKIFARIESFINDDGCNTLLKTLLNMNQQERTNLSLQQLWCSNSHGIAEEFPDESYLMLNGFLYANFMEINSNDQEIYLGNKEYFRGECLGSLPNGKCQLNSNNFSLKGEFSKGKFTGNGEIFNSLTTSNLEVDSIEPSGGFKGSLKKLSFLDQLEMSSTISTYGLNLDEKLLEKLTTGFMTNEEAGWSGNGELEDMIKWEIVVKYLLSFKNFNRNSINKLFCIDNSLVYWNSSHDGSVAEFILTRCHYICPFFLVYDEKIAAKSIFFCSFFSFGIFQLPSKPNFRNSIPSLFQNINGVKYTFPGIKEMGIFSDFELQKGVKIREFLVSETLDNSKKIVLSKIIDLKEKERFEGLKKNCVKNYYGVETYANQNKYEGGFDEGKHSGKGVLTDSEGKILYKGYFSEGLPTWGLFYKEKTKKYEGVFKQIDGFYSEFQVKSIADLLENFIVEGHYLTPEEKIIATFGVFNLKDPLFDLTGNFHLIYDTLNEYDGFLEKGIKRGLGSYVIKRNGIVHISIKGYWEANQVRAVIHWDSQNSFEKSIGNFSFNDNGNYIMGDFGLLYFKNGNKYEGLLSNNKLQGFGDFQQNVNGLRKSYRGQFFNSLRNGHGVLEDINTDTKEIALYHGNFVKNKKSGYGTLKINDFLLLDGIFFDNAIKFGCLYLKNHKVFERIAGNLTKKQGSNSDYSPIGYGIAYLKDGRSLECDITQILDNYMNEFVGKINFPNSKKYYQGTLKGLKPNSFGELYRNGNLLYSGEFLDGKFHGFGKLKIGTNHELVGEFKKGVKEGFGMEFDLIEKRCIFKGYWEHGMKVRGGMLKNEEKGNSDASKKFFRMKNNGINQVLIDL